MAGEVITTGARAADAARADADQGTALEAEQAKAAVAAGVPDQRALNGDSAAPQATGRKKRPYRLHLRAEPGPGFDRTDGTGLRDRYHPGSAGQGGGRAEPGP